jgi:hypothetical protein
MLPELPWWACSKVKKISSKEVTVEGDDALDVAHYIANHSDWCIKSILGLTATVITMTL